jgi:ABC-2 type transport system permease protein
MNALWSHQTRAILWAQLRTLRNIYPRTKPIGIVLSTIGALVWYGIFFFIALSLVWVLSSPTALKALPTSLPSGLLLILLYWQLVPLVLVTAGLSLDLRRLRVYPIPDSHLFWIEVVLRASTGVEMLILLTGAAIGLGRNAALPFWCGLAFIPYSLFNLLLATGIKDLFSRALARKRLREIVILFCVSLGALPQLLGIYGLPLWLRQAFEFTASVWSPWGAVSQLIIGPRSASALLSVTVWLGLAFAFARWQFHRSLFFDAESTRAQERATSSSLFQNFLERLYRLPRYCFADPLAALVEKELRFLSRAPRFRLVFFMGFTFGMMLWLPIALGRSGRGIWENPGDGILSGNFFTIICLYALTLLGEVAFWNNLGFDRAAGQIYFLAPVPFSTVLLAKNIAAMFFVLLEVLAVSTVVLLLRLPVGWSKFPEALAVAIVFATFLMSAGNIGSVLYPRPVDPAQSWRTSSGGRVQALLLLVYPIASLPILAAFLIRKTTHSELAFYGALGVAFILSAFLYRWAMRVAVRTAEEKREEIAALLSATQSPIA